jgi:hypothetical protein
MKRALLSVLTERRGRLIRGLLPVWLVVMAAGCKSFQISGYQLGPSYRPTNIYRRYDTLPLEIKRVAVLPLSSATPTALAAAGIDALEPILYAELEKTKRFEVIPVSTEQMRQWTGQTRWRADELLPPDLFERLRQATGCDAVLFSQLTRYQPYQPLAIGWKFSLIEKTAMPAATPSAPGNGAPVILWSADEVLDAGDPEVTNAARSYYSQHLRNEAPLSDSSTVLSSPGRFGQYTLGTLLATLPARKNR